MEQWNFDHHIAGSKTFWIIAFNKEANDIKKPFINYIIPSPYGNNQWIDVGCHSNALQSLNEIQQACKELKKECEIRVEKPEEYLDKAKKVSEELSTLGTLIKRFNEMMKRFKNPPPKDQDQSP